MTSMAIILALLPEAHRLATVPETNGPLLHAVIDDMITSPPLLTLVVAPAVYSLAMHGAERFENRK